MVWLGSQRRFHHLGVIALAVLALGAASPAGGPPPSRVVRFDGPAGGADVATDVVASADGTRFFVSGWAYAGADHGEDFVTLAYNANGGRLWGARYDGPAASIDEALAVAVDPQGERVFITGNSFGGPGSVTDMVTVAYDADSGRELWVGRYDSPAHGTDAGSSLAVSPDGQTVYVTGASTGADGMLHVPVVAYQAATGDRRWASRYSGPVGTTQEGLSIAVAPGGGSVFATGYQFGASLDALAIRLDAAGGSIVWSKALDLGGDEVARSLAVSPDDRLVVVTGARTAAGGGGSCDARPAGVRTGSTGPTGPVGSDYLTVALDTGSGDSRWGSFYDGPAGGCDEAFDVAIDGAGARVFVTGSSFGAGTDGDYATVAYGMGHGSELWATRYDGPDSLYDRAGEVVVAPDSQTVYVTGLSTGAATAFDYATLAYGTITGDELWAARYDGPGSGFDAPNGIDMSADGARLYVTGTSAGLGGAEDYATIVFRL